MEIRHSRVHRWQKYIKTVGISQGSHRFKAITYADISKTQTEIGENRIGILVKFVDETQLRTMILQYENNIKNLLGASFSVKIETTKILPENKAVLNLTVTETTTNKKNPTNHLQLFFN